MALPGGGMTRAAIVIFGAAVRADGRPSGALLRRVQAAAAFGAGLDRPLYVPTGGIGRHGPAEAAVMAGLLRAQGVAQADILLEPTALNTVASVRAVRRLLRGWGGPVYAATGRYHLPRCVLLLRLAGVPARAAPPPPGPAARGHCRRWYWRLREVPAVPWDAAFLLWLRVTGRL